MSDGAAKVGTTYRREGGQVRGPEHVSIAVATADGAFWLATHTQTPSIGVGYLAVAGAAALGALVPDIDHPQALIGNGLPAKIGGLGLAALLAASIGDWSVAHETKPSLGGAMIAPLLQMLRPGLKWAWLAVGVALALVLLSLAASTLLGHRGPTHSLTAALALTLVACVAFAIGHQAWWLGLWFGWGYLSHLLADMTTKMGCPAMLWPIQDLRFPNGLPAPRPMKRPGAQSIETPVRNTSANAVRLSDSPIPVEDPQSINATGTGTGRPRADRLEDRAE